MNNSCCALLGGIRKQQQLIPIKLNQVFCFVLIEFCAFEKDFLQPAVPIVLPNINSALSFALFLILILNFGLSGLCRQS